MDQATGAGGGSATRNSAMKPCGCVFAKAQIAAVQLGSAGGDAQAKADAAACGVAAHAKALLREVAFKQVAQAQIVIDHEQGGRIHAMQDVASPRRRQADAFDDCKRMFPGGVIATSVHSFAQSDTPAR